MNLTSLVSHFPQELIDRVIEENRDTPTLRSCALVCRSFLRASQVCIFSHVELVTQSKPSPSRPLYLALQHSPHLCQYVSSLKIVIGAGIASRLVTLDPTLVAILGMLHALTSFDFEKRDGPFQRGAIPVEVQSAICDLCARSQLQTVRLRGLDVQMSEFTALVASPALRDLLLMNVGFPPMDDGDDAGHGQIKLTRCCLDVTASTLDAVMRWLAGGDAFAHLRCLQLAFPLEATSRVQRIIDAAWNLDELALTLKAEGRSASAQAPNPVVLPAARALRVLRLKFVLRVPESPAVVPWLAVLLCGASALTDILIRIYVFTSNPLAPIPSIDWAPLASALDAAHLPGLTRFALEFASLAPGGFPQHLQEVVDEARRDLSGLAERGVLDCREISGPELWI
ncbi:hypothetical protein FB451DRAFT_698579 [Mycena latifolia]|nr:hypothetical protein FB451DRAFT_698579 [Mycena latifolia]